MTRIVGDNLQLLLNNYEQYVSDGRLSDLADKIGVTKTSLCRAAKRHGLTNISRKKSPEHCKKNGEATKKMIAENGHPKGHKGCKHSAETKEKISKTSISMWEDPNSKLHSEEHKQLLSDRLAAMQAGGKMRNGYSRGKQGRRKDLGNVYFRSSWEANIARYLNWLQGLGEIYKWEFEPDTFWFEAIRRGVRSYLPDFKIWDSKDSVPYYWEIKGWMDKKSKTKIKRMAKYHPDVKLIVIQKKEYSSIMRSIKGLVPNIE